MSNVEVLYKCPCMADEQRVMVRERREEEDVVFWVEKVVGLAIAVDHRQRSPLCRSKVTEYVKIGLPPDADFVGQGPRLS